MKNYHNFPSSCRAQSELDIDRAARRVHSHCSEMMLTKKDNKENRPGDKGDRKTNCKEFVKCFRGKGRLKMVKNLFIAV